jgi:hypothetical protein
MTSTSLQTIKQGRTRRQWTTPRVINRGAVGEIIGRGGGKSSLPLDGDGRKPRGLG